MDFYASGFCSHGQVNKITNITSQNYFWVLRWILRYILLLYTHNYVFHGHGFIITWFTDLTEHCQLTWNKYDIVEQEYSIPRPILFNHIVKSNLHQLWPCSAVEVMVKAKDECTLEWKQWCFMLHLWTYDPILGVPVPYL